jgi:hypothetical protein
MPGGILYFESKTHSLLWQRALEGTPAPEHLRHHSQAAPVSGSQLASTVSFPAAQN